MQEIESERDSHCHGMCVENSDRNEITIRHNAAKPIWNLSFRGTHVMNSTCVCECVFRSFGMGQIWSRWAWASEPFRPFYMSSRRVWFMSLNLSLSLCFSFHLLFSRALGDLYAISLVHICALHSCMNFKDFWTWHFRQFLSSTSLKPHLANRCLNDFHLSVDYDYDSTDSHRL